MDLSFMVIDLSSYLFGVLTLGGAWFATAKGQKIIGRKKGQHVAQAVSDFLQAAEPVYLKWVKEFKPLDDRYASAVSDFKLTFPKNHAAGQVNLLRGESTLMRTSHMLSTHSDAQSTLEKMLSILNTVKTGNLEQLDMKSIQSSWDSTQDAMKKYMYALPNAAQIFEHAVQNMPRRIQSAQNTQHLLKQRLDKAEETIARIEKAYDPLFWDKIPPALKRARTAYETAMEEIAVLDKEFYFYPETLNRRLNTAETMIKRLENHIDKVVNYQDVAHRKAGKLRQDINRAWQLRFGSGRKTVPEGMAAMFEQAKLSLLTAEIREYSGGNPEKDFEETIEPYYTLLKSLNAKK